LIISLLSNALTPISKKGWMLQSSDIDAAANEINAGIL
jgi:hypothetical protein